MTVRHIVINRPEMVLLTEKTDVEYFAKEIRTLAAVKHNKLDHLSSARADELAEISRIEFMLAFDG